MIAQQIAADLNTVITHCLVDTEGLYRMPAHILQIAEWGLTKPEELGILVGWVLNNMREGAEFRPLTDDEILVYSAGLRVQEVIEMVNTLALLGDAIAAKDWDTVRPCWLLSAPHHATIIGLGPAFAELNVILQHNTPPSVQ